MLRRDLEKRLKLCQFIFNIGFLGFLIGLFILQGFNGECKSKAASDQRIGSDSLIKIRGKIFSSDGELLAWSKEASSLVAHPKMMKNPLKVASALACYLGQDPAALKKRFMADEHYVPVLLKMGPEQERKMSRLLAQKHLTLEGLNIEKELSGRRIYPKGKLARPLLGCTGVRDDWGLSGIEYSYNNTLSARPVRLIVELGPENIGLLPGGKKMTGGGKSGLNLVLTLDSFLQHVAERELYKAVKESHAAGGNIIIMDAATGAIYAMASAPFCANRNSCIQDLYECGSVMKVFTVAAALDSGIADLKEKFYSGNSMQVENWTLHNANDGLCSDTGFETAKDILTYSFNNGAASIALKFYKRNPALFTQYIRKFGFGKPTGIGLGGDEAGLLPEEIRPLHNATMSYGQGISVSPLQLVGAMQALANKGVKMKPYVVDAVVNDENVIVKKLEPQVDCQMVSPKVAEDMKPMLESVVVKGTGKRAQIPGYRVGGKTGTANVPGPGGYLSGCYVASFLGYAPIEQPKIVMLVKIDRPQGYYYGGLVAAPIFATVGEEALRHLKVPPEPKFSKLQARTGVRQ